MNSVDVFIIIVVLVSSALGIYWGLIRQVLSIVGLIAGIVLATRYGPEVAVWLASFIENDAVAQVLGFLFVLITVSSLASLLASILHRFAGLLFLGWLDHLAGGILGLVQAVIALTVLLAVAAAFPNQVWIGALANSQIAPTLIRLGGGVFQLLPDSFRFASQMMFNAP